MTLKNEPLPAAPGFPVERMVRREFGPLRFSVRKLANGEHVIAVPHSVAVDWFRELNGNGRQHFNPKSPAAAAHGLCVEWPTGPARVVIGWDHEDGWPVVSDGPQYAAVRA